MPTYTDVTGRAGGSILPASTSRDNADPKKGNLKQDSSDEKDEVPDVDDLEEFDEVADVFESTYNFRFEEPYVVCLLSSIRTD